MVGFNYMYVIQRKVKEVRPLGKTGVFLILFSNLTNVREMSRVVVALFYFLSVIQSLIIKTLEVLSPFLFSGVTYSV